MLSKILCTHIQKNFVTMTKKKKKKSMTKKNVLNADYPTLDH